jgi:hypothetical protein
MSSGKYKPKHGSNIFERTCTNREVERKVRNLIQNQEAVGSCNGAGSKTVSRGFLGSFIFVKCFCSTYVAQRRMTSQ